MKKLLGTMRQNYEKISFLHAETPQALILVNVAFIIAYFLIITFAFPKGNPILFALLIAGEVFHVWQVLVYLYTIWDVGYRAPGRDDMSAGVDVFITVAGEEASIVETTVEAAQKMRYPNFSIYLLNDGCVAGKENWQEAERIAERYGISCITRQTPGGAKAGNINHALERTRSPYVVIFDADHIPHEDFLEKTMPYFSDPKMGFVQSPQYYKNNELNSVTNGSWEQQELFFGPICRGKNRMNSVTMCGTNMVISRQALEEVGGMCTESIAEDFITGMLMHSKGWKSYYVREVLAEGLAPEDFLSYHKQQFRWARGGLDVLFRLKYNIFLLPGLTFSQRLQYLSGVSFWFSGIVVAIDALMPLVFFYTGEVPIITSTLLLAAIFLPYMFITLYTLQRSCNFNFTFQSLAFSSAGFMIHLKAVWSALIGQKNTFSITPKKGLTGNFLYLVRQHIAYIILAAVGFEIALMREGVSASLLTNSAWAFLNIAIFYQFIRAAYPEREAKKETRRTRLAHDASTV